MANKSIMVEFSSDFDLAAELGDAARIAYLEHGKDAWITIGKAIVAKLRDLEAVNPTAPAEHAECLRNLLAHHVSFEENRAALKAAIVAINAQAAAEPVSYQYREMYEGRPMQEWQECRRATYDFWMRPENAARGTAEVRALYAGPFVGQPTAWVRFCSDGNIEGPILDCDRRMDGRRESGAWTPLFAPEKAGA